MTEQEKLLIELNEEHTKMEEERREHSRKFGKDLNEAQYKKDKALSDDAYPDNAHFIYEIIQNAEDSLYSKNKKAELSFNLLDSGVLVLSNQDGFTDNDIRSICVMASGGKIANKDQFIGEKGLGFRSVFKITDTPCISSNGYEFFFDRKQSYEKPFLLKEFKQQIPNLFKQYQYTAIYLPYRINKKEIDELEDDFVSKIKPKLILFLKKLNSIGINNKNKSYMSIERKKEKDENFEISKLSGQKIKQDYYIVKKDIDTSSIDEEKRKGITKRELILAYPKNLEKDSNNVFAFLPTEIDSRLNFTIQADFLLDTSRGQILENEWNKKIFEELKQFIIENINKFQSHSKLKYTYLNYYLQETRSNNKFIDDLYPHVINEIKIKDLIFSTNETWQKPKNIILLEDNIEIETKYLKILFGQQYEQVHEKFELDDYFIEKFEIKKIDKEKLLEEIYQYLDKHNDINIYNKDEVLYFTNIIAKYLNFGRDPRKFDEDYFKKIKKSLPILPKYNSEKKLYLYDTMYISSEYKPDILIENMCKESDFDFSKYNFLSNDYLDANNKNLENFIRKVIEEQQEHKNRKTLNFFTKYPEILQNYLKKNIHDSYTKILDFLIKNQEDNKEKISNIFLLLTQKGNFKSAKDTVYFSNDSDVDLEVLDDKLLKLVHEKPEYKEFLTKAFNVKEADIVNIIINEYLPWIKNNIKNRDKENDKKLLEYTIVIIENFSKFEKDQKDNIKNDLVFISSNSQNEYRKSSNIYLPQDISQIVFGTNSIETYIIDKSIFEFLDTPYNQILETLKEDKTKEFFSFFSFEKDIKDGDIANFIKYIKPKLDLENNIEALTLISKSIDESKIPEEIKNFKVYSQKKELIKIEELFFEKVGLLDINFLHEDYKKQIIKKFKQLRKYFLFEYDIEPFIKYLKNDLLFDEAIKVYEYLDEKKEKVDFQDRNKNHTITTAKIRQNFKEYKLIYSKNNKKYFSSEVTWKEEKSNATIFALSLEYPKKLQNFFIKIVQISQTKDIRQIINQIKDAKEKNDDYIDLLIDLNDLIDSNDEIDKYDKSYDSKIQGQYDSNIYENAKQFILKKEQIFILDDGKKNKSEDFYFNNLGVKFDNEKLKSKIFSITDRYPTNYYDKLVDTLKIKRLKDLERKYANRAKTGDFDIQQFREMLCFAYDLLFTKFPDAYKQLKDKENDLKELNDVETISIHMDIVTQIVIEDINIEVESAKHYFSNNILYIVDKKDLFKIISEKIGSIGDKDIKDFYSEVIEGSKNKETYYHEEKIKEKQHFPLNISDVVPQEQSTLFSNKSTYQQEENNDYRNNYDKNTTNETKEQKSEEDKRKERKSGVEQIGDYQRDVGLNSPENISPSIVIDKEKYQEEFKKNKTKMISEILSASASVSKKIKNKISKNSNQKIGDEVTKSKFASKEWYRGQCQICGFTFKTNNGNHFERFTWTDFGRGGWTYEQKQMSEHSIIDESNSLCLCSRCHSILKHGGQFKASFLTPEFKNKPKSNDYTYDQFIEDMDTDRPLKNPECFKEHVEWEDMYFLKIELNNNEEYIYFTEEHLLSFFTFLKE